MIDSLSSWRAEGDAVSNRQNVARHFEHFNGRSWSSSLQRGHFILCVLGNLFPSTSKGRHLSCERALFYQKRKMSCFLEATPGWYRSFGRVITWDQALFSFRFENYIPAGKAKRNESLIQTFNEMSAPKFLIDWHLPNQPIRITSVPRYSRALACFTAIREQEGAILFTAIHCTFLRSCVIFFRAF